MRYFLMNFLIQLMNQKLRKKASTEQSSNYVHLPAFLAILGLIGFLLCTVPAVIILCSDGDWATALLLFLGSLLGTSLIMAYFHCRIRYDEDGFHARNFLGIKRYYTYGDVTGLRENPHETFIYMGKHHIMVDEYSIGGKEFIIHIKKKYSALHNRQMVPRIKSKSDLFNGNVPGSGTVLFGFILVTLLFLALIAWLCFSILTPNNAENTESRTVCFDSYTLSEDEVGFYAVDGNYYAIRFIDEQFDPTAALSICDGETPVTVYIEEVTPDYEDPYYDLKAIVADDSYLLHFEETDKFHHKEYWLLILFFAIILLLWFAFMIAFTVVMRNPQKFSKRTVQFFSKAVSQK